MNADGSEQRTLGASLVQKVLGIGVAVKPTWSPDGEKIAFVSNVGVDNQEICVVNSDGAQRRRLTDIPGHDHWPPTWSPEGTRIAFTSDSTDGYGEIYVMNSDGTDLTKLTDHPSGPLGGEPPLADAFPAWRP
jgi:Tol biopolymer transport system component